MRSDGLLQPWKWISAGMRPASAFVLFHYENHTETTVHFFSPRSGALTVTKKEDLLTLNFPTDKFEQIELSVELTQGFNSKPLLAFKGKTDYLLVFQNEEDIKNIQADFDNISKLNARGVIVTAKSKTADFACRFFAPQSGINEDPVTGSAYTTLTPYWAKELGKTEMTAIQLSERKGYLQCRYLNDRVEISGKAVLYMRGTIHIE